MQTVCSNCGRVVGAESVIEEGLHFCSTICRYEWRQKGKPIPVSHHQESNESVLFSATDFELPIPVDGFWNHRIILKTSYWRGPVLFLDKEKLKPVKGKLFSRTMNYRITNDRGEPISIKLHRKPFDAVPIVEVAGTTIQLVRRLSAWEYIWIGIPIILLFAGGAIGGGLAAAAIYSNSILIRRIKPIIPRYIMTGATTAIAFFLFLKAALFLNPYFQDLSFRSAYTHSESRPIDLLTSRSWICSKIIDTNGVDFLGKTNPMLNSKRFFKGDGSYSQLFMDGSNVSGTWRLDTLTMSITLTINEKLYVGIVKQLDEKQLMIQTENVTVMHQSDI